MENNKRILEDNGWEVVCESPFEIKTEDGSFASGEAASIILYHLKQESEKSKKSYYILFETYCTITNEYIKDYEIVEEYKIDKYFIKKWMEEKNEVHEKNNNYHFKRFKILNWKEIQ